MTGKDSKGKIVENDSLKNWEVELLEFALGENPAKSSHLIGEIKKKATIPNKEEDKSNLPQLLNEINPLDQDHCLFFDNPDDRSKASKKLMGCGVPWREMGDKDNQIWLKFEPNDHSAACGCLGDEYNFTDSKKKKVAVIEFDDYWMYEKVLRYMKKFGGVLEFGDDKYSFDEGYDDYIDEEASENVDPKVQIMKPPKNIKPKSFKAGPRRKMEVPDQKRIRTENKHKICRVRRDWKTDSEE